MLNVKPLQFTAEQLDAFKELKESLAWGVISNLASKIMSDFCNLNEVDEKLLAEEYKTQCLAKKLAKKMFNQIFEDIEFTEEQVKKSKKRYL